MTNIERIAERLAAVYNTPGKVWADVAREAVECRREQLAEEPKATYVLCSEPTPFMLWYDTLHLALKNGNSVEDSIKAADSVMHQLIGLNS